VWRVWRGRGKWVVGIVTGAIILGLVSFPIRDVLFQRQAQFLATIDCVLIGKNLQAIMDRSLSLDGLAWLEIKNAGSIASGMDTWSIEVKSVAGNPLNADVAPIGGPLVMYDPLRDRNGVKVWEKDSQVGDRLYKESVKPGTGTFGSLHSTIRDGGIPSNVDLRTLRLKFRDIATSSWWQSSPFDGAACRVSGHQRGEPFPNPPGRKR
jgi:hypothetical protein